MKKVDRKLIIGYGTAICLVVSILIGVYGIIFVKNTFMAPFKLLPYLIPMLIVALTSPGWIKLMEYCFNDIDVS